MLHILVVLLKILFFLLLSVFLMVLVAVVSFLFVPVRYRVHLQKESDGAEKQNDLTSSFRVQINVHWLLHLIHAAINIRGTDTKVRVTLFGYPVIGRKRTKSARVSRKKSKHQSENMRNEAKSDEEAKLFWESEEFSEEFPESDDQAAALKKEKTIPTDREKKKAASDVLPENLIFTEKEEEVPGQTLWSAIAEFIRMIFRAAKDFWLYIGNSFRQMRDTLRNIRESYQRIKRAFTYYQRLWYDEHTKKAKERCIKEIRYILRHYLPKMQKGELVFGLGDPALTGQVLGGLCAWQGLTGGRMQINADFEQFRLEGDVVLKGHIRFCHLVKTAFLLFFDKDIRVTVRRIRKMQGKPEE